MLEESVPSRDDIKVFRYSRWVERNDVPATPSSEVISGVSRRKSRFFKTGKVRELEENVSELSGYLKGKGFKCLFKALEEGDKDGHIGHWNPRPFVETNNEVGETRRWFVVGRERGARICWRVARVPV